jgi:hypothetical protein
MLHISGVSTSGSKSVRETPVTSHIALKQNLTSSIHAAFTRYTPLGA